VVIGIREYQEAKDGLEQALGSRGLRSAGVFTEEVKARLVDLIFGEQPSVFWDFVQWFRTPEKLDPAWLALYREEDRNTPLRSRDVEAALNKIKDGINGLCKKGALMDLVLRDLDLRARERLGLPPGENVLLELRAAIKENEERLSKMIPRGPPAKADYLIDYLLVVFRHVCPGTIPTGTQSNPFRVLVEAVFSACFYVEGGQRAVAATGLESRIRACVESEKVLFEYLEQSRSVVPTLAMQAEHERV